MNELSIEERNFQASNTKAEDLAWYFIFKHNKLLVKKRNDLLIIPLAKDFQNFNTHFFNKHFLGLFNGNQCYCMELDFEPGDEEMVLIDLFAFANIVNDKDLFIMAGKAFQILHWDRMSKFCGKCGSMTEEGRSERVKICPECGSLFYPRISPAVIIAVIKNGEILLAHNRKYPKNFYGLIAGFMEPGETFEACAQREIAEEVGIKVKNLNYFSSQPWPFPDSLMIGFTAEYESGDIMVDGVEIDDAGWYQRDNLPNLPPMQSIARKLVEWYLGKKES